LFPQTAKISSVNIGIDLRALAGKQTSGVKVYLRSILEELFAWDKKNTYLLWWNSAKEECPLEIPRSPRFKLVHTRYSNRFLNLRLRLQNQPFLDELLLREAQREKQKLDIFWLPDLRPVAVSNHCKLVITLHDLASTLHPEFFSLKTRAWFQFLNPEKITEKADRRFGFHRAGFTKDLENRGWQHLHYTTGSFSIYQASKK
jgi:hypothetical protein